MLAANVASAELAAEPGWLVVGTGKLVALESQNSFCLSYTFRRVLRRRKVDQQTPGKEDFSFSWHLRLGNALWDRQLESNFLHSYFYSNDL